MTIRRLSFLPLLFACLCLFSHGQNAYSAYAGLNGNWRLDTGGVFKFSDPNLTFGMDGNTIFGEGSIKLNCTDGAQEQGGEAALVFLGQIGSDGSFILQNLDFPHIPIPQISIQGKVPAAGANQWSGRIVASAFHDGYGPTPLNCPALSADFTAHRFANFNGTFSGTVRVGNTNEEAHVSLTVSQGRLTAAPLRGPIGYFFPLEARIVITGSSRFPSGAFVNEGNPGPSGNGNPPETQCCDRVLGTGFTLNFIEKDTGSLSAYGDADPVDENRLTITLQCGGTDEKGKSFFITPTAQLTREEARAR